MPTDKTQAQMILEILARDAQRMAKALKEVCYEPGGQAGFTHIDYCRWCHYADTHPHHPDCIMATVADWENACVPLDAGGRQE